jgi:hypothetical protein
MQTINLSKLSIKFQAYKNCIQSNNDEWRDKHEDEILKMLESLPNGLGFDTGIEFDWEKSTPLKLVFNFEYHHLNENGYYDGWTQHKLTITPTFGSYGMRITGRDRNQVKGYFYDIFSSLFTTSDDEK